MKKMTRTSSWRGWLLCVFLISLTLKAQELPDREIHYRPGDWISYPVTRYVTSIALGHQYTYFGTTGGITRFDFYRNRWDVPFTVSDGLGDDDIHVLAYDFSTGYVWCATNAGLSFRIPSSQQWLNMSYESLGIDGVSAIGTGKEFLWLMTPGRTLRGDRRGGSFWDSTPEEEESDDVQWYGGREQYRFESANHLFMEGGYTFFTEGYIQDSYLRQFDVTDAFEDNFFRLWLATWGLGSGVADMKSYFLELIPFGLYTSEVHAMAWDEGGMWIGGFHAVDSPGGITWWNMDNEEWVYFEAPFITQLRSDIVTAVAAGTRFVWFGTLEGLARYDKDKDAWRMFSVFNNLWDDEITCVTLGPTSVWVGTTAGINRISQPGMIVEKVRDERLIHRHIYFLETDGDDVWAATDRGIYRYIGDTGRWEYVPGYGGMVDLEVTAASVWENEVWFGTDDGIEKLDKHTHEWQGFPATHYPTGGTIYNILADSGDVWVGTEDGVLKYIKRENRWRRFTTEDGLLHNSVRWILLDGDYIWFGTGRGLTRFYWNAPYRVD